jgi:hypothetical protein
MADSQTRLIFLVIFFCFPIILMGQKKEIRFQYEMLDIPNSNIYIESVIDGRTNQKSIGSVEHNGKIDSIDLKDGATVAFYNYLKFILPKDDSKVPIVLQISDLSVNEIKSSPSDSVKANLTLAFFKKDSGKLNKIYESHTSYSASNNDGLNGFERSLKQSLSKCLTDFITTDKMISQTQTAQIKTNQITQNNGINQESPTNETAERVRREYMLTYTNTQGVNATGFLISFYSYPNKDRNGWTFPWIISVDILSIKPAYFDQFNYQSAKLNYYMPGISAFKKINDYLWFNLGMQIPIGSEELTDFNNNKSDNMIIGLSPTQGLYFIPKSTGITFGIGLYEIVMTSEVYKSDMGFKAEIGIKF